MKIIQDALAPTGLPVYAQVWQPTEQYPELPPQYLVYSVMVAEDQHYDDKPALLKYTLYLNLWSDRDVTQAVNKVRAAMYQAGFAMLEETTKGYNQPQYNEYVNLFGVSWTWVGWERLDDGL